MTFPAPSPADLMRFLHHRAVADLLEAGARISGEYTDELEALQRELEAVNRRRLEAAGQLELDLSRVRPDVITPCMSPPRAAIRDYAQWLRAGGGRAVNAPCSETCPCGGTSPWAQDTFRRPAEPTE